MYVLTTELIFKYFNVAFRVLFKSEKQFNFQNAYNLFVYKFGCKKIKSKHDQILIFLKKCLFLIALELPMP